MLSLIKRIWQNGETVDADKMNTISTDLDTLNTGKIDEPETAGTENQVLSIDSLGRRIWRTVTGGSSVWGQITGTLSNQTDLQTVISGLNADIAQKQATLVSGTNIKTINNNSLLGSGNIDIQGGGGTWGSITGTLSDQTDLANALASKLDTFATLLWTNANPSSEFAAQTINLDCSAYKMIMVVCRYKWDVYHYSTFILYPSNGYCYAFITNTLQWAGRAMNLNTAKNTITFDPAYQINSFGSRSLSNGHCIPYQIYGTK